MPCRLTYPEPVPTVLLVRHGRTSANATGVLAGRAPGTQLDKVGREQSAALAEQLAGVRLVRVVSSPLERTVATAQALVDTGGSATSPRPEVSTDDRLNECDYGEWTGRRISELAKDPVWKTVQSHPSAALFPGGETLRAVQQRAVDAVREHDAAVAAEHGPNAVWVAVSHGDVIKAVLADALGTHLDAFQRIVVDPCSVSVVHYAPLRPFVLRTNGSGQGLESLGAPPKKRRARGASSDAVVGGGSG